MNRITHQLRAWPLLVVFLLVAGCGGFPTLESPVGEPQLPDLVPEPPIDVRLTTQDGVVEIRFSSTLVNVGEGDFVLRADRSAGDWVVQQEIWYSESGAELVTTDAELHYAGDGHEHWHVKRVVTYGLVPLDEKGEPLDVEPLTDSKVGFCFYDHDHSLDFGREQPRYDVHECGDEEDDQIRMGMSPGWADIYGFSLPGQSIDITGLDDGVYRLVVEADVPGWFVESTKDNNLTWVDIELGEHETGVRVAEVVDVGPRPGD